MLGDSVQIEGIKTGRVDLVGLDKCTSIYRQLSRLM